MGGASENNEVDSKGKGLNSGRGSPVDSLGTTARSFSFSVSNFTDHIG